MGNKSAQPKLKNTIRLWVENFDIWKKYLQAEQEKKDTISDDLNKVLNDMLRDLPELLTNLNYDEVIALQESYNFLKDKGLHGRMLGILQSNSNFSDMNLSFGGGKRTYKIIYTKI